MTDPTPTRDEAVIAGRTLEEWRIHARRDDCLERMVPSDLRQLIGAIPASAPAPASGRVDAVARRAKYLLNRLETDDGLGIGEIDTMLRMAASLSPAATPVSEAVRPIGNQGISDYQREIARNMAEGFAAWNAARQEALPSDEPASSPAGGDVREAVLAALRQAASGGASGLADHEIEEIANDLLASLSQSTSAGRVGE